MALRNIVTFGQNGELLAELNRHAVRFLVVGGVAVHFHAPERNYDDLDILIDPNPVNAGRCLLALQMLGFNRGFPLALLTQPKKLIPLKRHHYADVVTPASDVDFARELQRSADAMINYQRVLIASRDLLMRMKSGTDRPKDAQDIELLRRAGGVGQ
jgi:hypothetical protein